MTLGEEACLVASDDGLEETGRNLDKERNRDYQRGIVNEFQVN